MSIKYKHIIVFTAVMAISFVLTAGFCAEPKPELGVTPAMSSEPVVYAGEFLDTKVPMQNYIFMKDVVTIFNNRMGPETKTEREREDYIWDQLLLSYEAFRKNIAVPQEEVDNEISNILAEYKVDFDWKNNKAAFEKWLREKAGEPAELFGNQVRQLLQIEKLRQQTQDSIQPVVTEEEARSAFLDEYNSLSIELAQFDSQKDADAFYRKIKGDPKLWELESGKNPNMFKKPGFVSLVFLIDIWKIPRNPAYNMLQLSSGTFYPPAPIYKGYAVFKVLETRLANDADFAKAKDSYFDKVKKRKQYQGYNEWFNGFKEQAKIKVYPAAGPNKKEGGQEK